MQSMHSSRLLDMAKKKEDGRKTRQKNGTGSFYHRKDGSVEYRVYLGKGLDGKPWRPSFYGSDETEPITIGLNLPEIILLKRYRR